MIQTLQRLKILDTDGTLSLSHIVLGSSLVMLLMNPSRECLLAFTISILNFNAKKGFSALKDKKTFGDMEKVNRMEIEIARLAKEFETLNAITTWSESSR